MRQDRGFTLAELLIVVAIIAVLVAIAIPVFSSQLTQAKASADKANVRSAEAAAVAQFMSDNPGEDTTYYFDAGAGTVTTDSGTASQIKGYGQSTVEVEGAAGIPNEDGVAKIVSVTVKVDGTYAAFWRSSGTNAALDSFAAAAAAIRAGHTGYYSGNDLIKDAGTLPSTKASQLCTLLGVNALYQAGGDTELYWRPNAITVDGKTAIILYANAGSTGSANWQGYAVYYNGSYYKSTNINSRTGETDRANVQTFSSYLATGTGPWEKVS